MKGLIQAGIIVTALIVIGIITSVVLTNNLSEAIVAAREDGSEEGYAQGYAMGYLEGSKVGFQEGSRVGYGKATGEEYDSEYGGGFHFLYNPAYDEVWEILAEDDKHSAREINNAAEDKGIRAMYVRCRIASRADEGKIYTLYLVAFETVDRGLIFIDPSPYQEVKLEIGRNYTVLNMLPPSKYDGIITQIQIIR